MVKNKKSLFCISIILLFLNISVFSQTQPNASFENDTSYFSEETTGTETGTATQTYKAPSTARLIIRMVVVLALVIAALYGIMIFFKKKNNAVQSDDDFLRRVSSLNLSPGKSVEIVTLVDRGFILGVTESNINLIAEIDDKEMISALNLNFDKKQNTKKPMNFSDVLEMFMPGGLRKNTNIYNTTEGAEAQTPQTASEENNETNENS